MTRDDGESCSKFHGRRPAAAHDLAKGPVPPSVAHSRARSTLEPNPQCPRCRAVVLTINGPARSSPPRRVPPRRPRLSAPGIGAAEIALAATTRLRGVRPLTNLSHAAALSLGSPSRLRRTLPPVASRATSVLDPRDQARRLPPHGAPRPGRRLPADQERARLGSALPAHPRSCKPTQRCAPA